MSLHVLSTHTHTHIGIAVVASMRALTLWIEARQMSHELPCWGGGWRSREGVIGHKPSPEGARRLGRRCARTRGHCWSSLHTTSRQVPPPPTADHKKFGLDRERPAHQLSVA